RVLEAEGVANDLDHRHQAVGRARSVRDDRVLGRIVLVAVDTHDDGDVFILGWRGYQYFLRPTGDMLSRGSGVREAPRRFEDDVDAQVLPRESSWILLRENLDLVTVDDD